MIKRDTIHTNPKPDRTLKNNPADYFSRAECKKTVLRTVLTKEPACARGDKADHKDLQTNAMPVFRKGTKSRKGVYLLILIGFLTACSDFVTVELPKNQLISEVVFEDPATAEEALNGIYIKMRDGGLLSGKGNGLTHYLGVYADDLDYNSNWDQIDYFQYHTMRATNTTLGSWWNSTYNQIYAANAIIEGVSNSTSLASADSNQFKGEALFIRAYLHLLLVALYGDIPYITTTDYIENTNVSRLSKRLVYDHIITDLELAQELLPDQDFSLEKVRPYRAVANAALAQAYLYAEDWALAAAAATRIIDQFGTLESDLSTIFIKEASGTIWQFKPNFDNENTAEGNHFIFISGPPSQFSLRDDFINDAFEANDLRKSHWIGTVTNTQGTWYHAFKYKERNNTDSSVEYSIQFRLAEQYLIRAEARAHLGDNSGAQEDLNQVRNRAGLGNTSATTLSALLNAILQERRVEFFTERGHRWFDLKRMGKAAEVLAPIKPNWRGTDVLFPIPEGELLLNPNLLPQNSGY